MLLVGTYVVGDSCCVCMCVCVCVCMSLCLGKRPRAMQLSLVTYCYHISPPLPLLTHVHLVPALLYAMLTLSYPHLPHIVLCVLVFPLQPKLTQDIKDFFKVLGRRMTRSSRGIPRQAPPPVQPPAVAKRHGMHVQTETTSSEASVSIPSLPEVPVAMDDNLDSLIAQLEAENR